MTQTEEYLSKELEARLRFEMMLAEISTEFINMPASEVDHGIQDAQRRVCECLDLDRSTLWQISERSQDTFLLTHMHQPQGGPPASERMQSKDLFPWLTEKLLTGEVLAISKLSDLPPEASRDQESFRIYGTKSTMLVPVLLGGGDVIGALSFATMREESDWSELLVKRIHLVAQVFANALARKRSEEALQKSEERFRQVAENVGDFIWEVDAKGLYRYTSPAVEKILGYTPDELIGKIYFYDLFAPETREDLKAAAFKAFAAKESFRAFPNSNVSKDGKIVHLETSGVPVLAEDGDLVGYRGSDTDVTERKIAEEALQLAFSRIKELKEKLEAENIYLREDINMQHNFDKIVGQSDALRYILFRVEQVAGTDATVLIQGETGTGKGVVAHAIHDRSPRKDRPMITVNCAALPANLIESELFGREKGAFTGSHARQMGRFEVANRGTIFLDEIGELPLELQAKLLRVIQDGEFERLGSPHTMKVDVRIIVSTSRNLREEIKEGRFREDLYYRLNVFPITIPPLRQRLDDVPLLVDHFVKKFSRKMGRQIKIIPREVMKALQGYAWPGNIRELEHVIERAMITTQGSVLRLAEKIDGSPPPDRKNGSLSITDAEREHILKALEKTEWRIEGNNGAASLLDLNPSTLRSRMQKLGIVRPNQNGLH